MDEKTNYLDLANQKLRKAEGTSSFYRIIFGVNHDELSELYSQAANLFKLGKNMQKASECSLKASNHYEKINDSYSQANAILDAAHITRTYSETSSIPLYKKAASIHGKDGRFHQAARITREVADLLKNSYNFSDASKLYKEAADYAALDQYGSSTKSQCLLLYAEITSRYLDELNIPIQVTNITLFITI